MIDIAGKGDGSSYLEYINNLHQEDTKDDFYSELIQKAEENEEKKNMKYGVFNKETKEIFKFDSLRRAYWGYFEIIKEALASEDNTASNWYIVYIDSNKIVQFEQYVCNKFSVTGYDLDKLNETEIKV